MSTKHSPAEQHIDRHRDGAQPGVTSKLHAEAVNEMTRKPTVHEESTKGAFSQHGYWSTRENDYYQNGQILVLEGDTLNTIARKALEMRGASTAGPDAVLDEADRIRALNMNRPNYKYLQNSHRITAGMILNVSEPRIGPDIHTAWQPWKDAAPGTTTYVHHGERAVAQPGAKVIVQPGAAAIINGGASGFGYQKSYIESMPGSLTVAAGEVSAAHGARVLKIRNESNVTAMNESAQQHPQIFPR